MLTRATGTRSAFIYTVKINITTFLLLFIFNVASLSFLPHTHTQAPVFTFLDSFVADMVYSQPAYIIKCTSDKGWLCLCFSNGTTLPFFLSPFLQALFE